MRRPPPSSTLFPYTTLFRSKRGCRRQLTELDARDGEIPDTGAQQVVAFGYQHIGGNAGTADRIREVENPFRPSDRKSTRLNSSHLGSSYAVFCLKKKNEIVT